MSARISAPQAPHPDGSSSPQVIYSSQGVLTLLSRSWYLLRDNLKTSLLLMLTPTIMLTVVSLLLSLPAAIPSLTGRDSLMSGMLIIVSFLAGMGLLGLSLFAWGYCCSALSRVYYSAIVTDEALPLKASLGFVRKIWAALLLVIVAIIAFSILCGVVNIVLYLVGFFGSLTLFASLGFMPRFTPGSPSLVMVLGFIVFLLWGFVILAAIVGLIAVQTFACLFPFISVANSTGKRLGGQVFDSLRLLLHNLPKALVYGVMKLLFTLILSIVFHAPVIIWAMLERMRMGTEWQMTLPFHVSLVFNLWSSLVNIFLVPYLVAAATLFWYDCRVRKEGLDLKLWFNRLAGRNLRRGLKNPEQNVSDFLLPGVIPFG